MPVAIPLAIVGAGVAGAAISGSAAKSAAQTQANAAAQATGVQQQMYQQTRADLSPFRDLGGAAGSSLARLLGLSTGGGGYSSGGAPSAPTYNSYLAANPDLAAEANRVVGTDARFPTLESYLQWHAANFPNENRPVTADAAPTAAPQVAGPSGSAGIQAELESLPGYQFTKNQGMQTVNRTLGSMGLTGAQAKGISRFVTGLADSTYNSQVANLQNATNTGENAAAQTGTIGANYGSGISNTITGAGAAQAAGTVGAANAITGGLSAIPGALLTNSILNGGRAGAGSGGSGIYGSGYTGSEVIPGT